MRRPLIASASIFAALALLALTADLGRAQTQVPGMPGGFKPPPAAPIKPYKPVAVTLPAPFSDASFEAFRKTLADIAKRKDRAGLAKLVVSKGFFWLLEKDMADPKKPGIDSLAKAIGLDAKDGSGWDNVMSFATEPTASDFPDRKGVMCAPADPTFDQKALQTLAEQTQTDVSEWVYPLQDGAEVRSAAQPNAPVIEKLGKYFIRVLPDTQPPQDPTAPAFLHVALPSGKSGFVAAEAISGLGGNQMCYTKDASGWKIAGFLGGGEAP